MQIRYVEYGKTIVDSDILTLNKTFFNPALIKGGELASEGSELKIYPSYVLMPNGILLEETEYRKMAFAGGDGWKTIFYRWNENKILGGVPIELTCIEGVYSQEELENLTTANKYVTVIGWVNKNTIQENTQFELVRPNNDKYSHYLMIPDDFVSNKIAGKDLLNYMSIVGPDTNIYYYDENIGAVALFGEPNPYSQKPQYLPVYNSKIVIQIPFTCEEFGSIIIERKADIGAEMIFSFISLEGEDVSESNSLNGSFDCKGTFEMKNEVLTTCSTYIHSTKRLKTDINSETEYHKVIVRPEQYLLATSNEEKVHEPIPKFGVFKIEILPPGGGCGSEGLQLLRSIGISKYNIPQILRS